MSNSKNNVLSRQLHGKFGNQVVFRTRNGKSVTANVPDVSNVKAGATQIAIRDKFKIATLWAKNELMDPVQLAAYRAIAKNGKTAFVAAVTDFLNPPKIAEINHSDYAGHIGDQIVILASDELKITKMQLKITDQSGAVLEQGPCQSEGLNISWKYTATVEVPSLTGATITAIAKDNPGHSGQSSVTLE